MIFVYVYEPLKVLTLGRSQGTSHEGRTSCLLDSQRPAWQRDPGRAGGHASPLHLHAAPAHTPPSQQQALNEHLLSARHCTGAGGSATCRRETSVPRVRVPPPPKTPLTSHLRSRRGWLTDPSLRQGQRAGGQPAATGVAVLRLGPVDLGAELRVQERKPWGHVALSTGLSAPHYPKPRLGRWPPFPHAARPPRRERTGSPSPGAAGAAEFRHTHELSPREAGAVASTWQIGTLRHRGVWDSAQAVGAYGPAPPVGRSAGVGGPPCLPKAASPASERAAGWDRVFLLRRRRDPPPHGPALPSGPHPQAFAGQFPPQSLLGSR